MKTKHVLIVDDEPRSRDGIKRTLEAWTDAFLVIHTAASAYEAFNIAEKEMIDLLITDIRMPEMSGLCLIEKLQEKKHATEYIVVSAYSEFNYAHHALELGVFTYLLKPVQKKKLLEAVTKALKLRAEKTRLDHVEKVFDTKLADVNHASEGFPTSVSHALAHIDQHYQSKIGIKEVANAVHLNPNYLSVLFKEHLGITFSDYVTRRRLQHAKHLLLSTNLPVAVIAEQAGYQTAKYFIKLFKDNEGITPSQYRKYCPGQAKEICDSSH
ncbi:response regulator [Salipaludibacillus agaradhaerens]|uniref:Response regulator n=1 Tax=Salipaludibacillus agaradhaerens TaxID=76935 RepID=A0A9Q4AXZ7_SALAG|nr:response regulator [Salipaludibacillus agaradhaerens]MCR6095083.1 response regulator [Salipaludibacillus agaradhaerens]MCR6115359.1 response regulator [Salipaludibacillus agaradhaerens]